MGGGGRTDSPVVIRLRITVYDDWKREKKKRRRMKAKRGKSEKEDVNNNFSHPPSLMNYLAGAITDDEGDGPGVTVRVLRGLARIES